MLFSKFHISFTVVVLSYINIARGARVRPSSAARQNASLLETGESIAEKFCTYDHIKSGCKRLAGTDGSGTQMVKEQNILSTISNIQYALQGTISNGFTAEDVTGMYFPLLDLKGVRVAAYYSTLWEPSEDEMMAREDLDEDYGEADDESWPIGRKRVKVKLHVARSAQLAPLLRGKSQAGDEWITTGLPQLAVRSGKFYFEFEAHDGYQNVQLGVVTKRFPTLLDRPDAAQDLHGLGQGVGDHEESWAINGALGNKYHVYGGDYKGVTWGRGSVIVGCALDLDNGAIRFSTNGQWAEKELATRPPDFILSGLISADAAFYPAVSMQGKGAFRLKEFHYSPPEGFSPLPEAEGEDVVLVNTWDHRVDFNKDIEKAWLPTQGGGFDVDRTMVAKLKSDQPAYGFVEEMHGRHVVISFDGDRIVQEVPIDWIVARVIEGRPVLVEREGDLLYARIGASAQRAGALMVVHIEGEDPISIPAADVKTELSTWRDDLISWQVQTEQGTGKVKNVDVEKGIISVEIRGHDEDFDFLDVQNAGPHGSYKSCVRLCKDVLSQLSGPVAAVEDAPIKALLPKDAKAFGRMSPRKLRRKHSSAGHPGVAKRHGPKRWSRKAKASGKSTANEPTSFAQFQASDNKESLIEKARWAIAGYFGAVPDFAAIDMDTLPDAMNNYSKADLAEQLREQAVMARQWLVMSMSAVADLQLGKRNHDMEAGEARKHVETVFGGSDEATLELAFDTFEASYMNMVNVVFRYEPLTEVWVDWADDPIYPSSLYHGPTCTEEEYDDGCEGCAPGTFAYVFPTGKNNLDSEGRRIVNLCPLFFNQTSSLQGMDAGLELWQGTRVGTLIHEVSHHLPSGTDDVEDMSCTAGIPPDEVDDEEEFPCYGFQNVVKVATEAQEKALQNADSYLYLSEMLARGKQVFEHKMSAWSDYVNGGSGADLAAVWSMNG